MPYFGCPIFMQKTEDAINATTSNAGRFADASNKKFFVWTRWGRVGENGQVFPSLISNIFAVHVG